MYIKYATTKKASKKKAIKKKRKKTKQSKASETPGNGECRGVYGGGRLRLATPRGGRGGLISPEPAAYRLLGVRGGQFGYKRR